MKKEYVSPELEVVVIEQADIITTSPNGVGVGGVGNQGYFGDRDSFGDSDWK